jgi:tellurite methyltransferase
MDSLVDDLYWNSFYEAKELINIPSQFSVFVANECKDIGSVIDLGCGNGRDSFFFASLKLNTIGIDSSSSAITFCNEKLKLTTNLKNANFFCENISDLDLFNKIEKILSNLNISMPILIYSRFFLHAINEEQEDLFIHFCSLILKKYGGKVALEFRTKRDELQTKVTNIHFRRFIDPIKFFSKIQNVGFKVEYFCEGFGYAKYKEDDAHVARFILTTT